jgi:imidazoleglycerol-phosphate dehydratase
MAHLFTLHEFKKDYVKIQKKTKELDIIVEISTKFDDSLHPETTSDFLDHIVDTLAWGSCMSIGVTVNCGKWRSTHTIAEDVGITIGAGMKKIYYDRLENEGVNIVGSGVGCLDESLCRCVIGVEGRRNCYINVAEECSGGRLEMVEDLRSQDLWSFVEGFFQGFPATCHLDLLKGRDPHHVWESGIHAMGEALRSAMTVNPWRTSAHNPYYGEEGIADAALI